MHLALPLPCPFCGADLLSAYESSPEPGDVGLCLTCLAAVTLAPDATDPVLPTMLKATLLELLPEGETQCTLEVRRLDRVGRLEMGNLVLVLSLLAAWNLDEMVNPALAARITGMSRGEFEALLEAGLIPDAAVIKPRTRLARPGWLVPRRGLLPYLQPRGIDGR